MIRYFSPLGNDSPSSIDNIGIRLLSPRYRPVWSLHYSKKAHFTVAASNETSSGLTTAAAWLVPCHLWWPPSPRCLHLAVEPVTHLSVSGDANAIFVRLWLPRAAPGPGGLLRASLGPRVGTPVWDSGEGSRDLPKSSSVQFI